VSGEANASGIRIGIVENDALFCQSFVERLKQIEGVCEVHAWQSAEAAYHDLQNISLDLIFIDIGLPGMSGSDLVPVLAERNPELRILMLTLIRTDDEIMRCLKRGAIGYILKEELIDLSEAVRSVMDGGAIMTPSIAARVLHLFRGPERTPVSLTPRETQVLEEIVSGYSAAEIARTFGTAEGTVRQQIKSIYSKLQVRSRVQLMRKARDLGFL
jgi:DNA-binding NarL/FixJ family response regulator